MKKCVTVWNYPGDRLENARKLHALGFDAISWLGKEFEQLTEEQDERLAALLKETGMEFTVHSGLPDPDQPEQCERFRRELRHAVAWQQKYGLMYSYTFDFWYAPERSLPYLGEALQAFRDTDVTLACEDIPLNRRQMKSFEKYLKPNDRFGILVDAGHMNIRQRCIELVEPEDFISSFQALPLPVVEVHLHDNLSFKDEHMYLGYGNLPLDAIIVGLKKKQFDGFATIEIVHHGWSEEQTFQYAVDSRERFLSRWNAIDI